MDSSIISWLKQSERDQFALLQRLVLQTSHTRDKTGVDMVGKQIHNSLADCSLILETDEQSEVGNNLIFSSAACSPASRPILLVGHMDTVFPSDCGFDFYREDDEKAYGPGIIDMKGGLVTAIFVLKALQHHNLLEKIPLVFICNSDEETGSQHSADLIRRYADRSCCGLVFECCGLDGEAVTGRKGKAGYRVQVKGRSGHAAFSARNGKASAVTELAHKIIALEELNDPSKAIVVNVGVIGGGTGANVIPGKAWADIDTRFIRSDDGRYLNERIQQIVETMSVAGTSATLSPTNSRFPMEQSEKNIALFRLFERRAEQLGIPLKQELRSGVSDANTIAEKGIPVIDGLGPMGDLDHSEEEYMVKNSLRERCTLAALTVLDIWNSQLSKPT